MGRKKEGIRKKDSTIVIRGQYDFYEHRLQLEGAEQFHFRPKRNPFNPKIGHSWLLLGWPESLERESPDSFAVWRPEDITMNFCFYVISVWEVTYCQIYTESLVPGSSQTDEDESYVTQDNTFHGVQTFEKIFSRP